MEIFFLSHVICKYCVKTKSIMLLDEKKMS